MIKKIFLSVLTLVLMMIGFGCANKSNNQTVKIGFQVIPNTEAIAKANGWHEEAIEDMKVEWLQFDSGRDVNTALASGSIDIGLLGSTLVANGLSKGIEYEVIWIADVIGANEALAIKNDTGIKSVQDLKGKKIAVTFGSTTQYTLLGALKVNGIEPNEVEIIDMQPPDMLAAWQRGAIDGGYVWHPTLQKMIDDNGTVLLDSGDLVDKGIITADVIVVRKQFAKEHPKVVEDYIASQIRATNFYLEKPREAVESVAKEFNLSFDETETMMKELIWLTGEDHLSNQYFGTPQSIGHFSNVLEDTANFLMNQGLIEDSPNTKTFEDAVNPSFIEKAMNE